MPKKKTSPTKAGKVKEAAVAAVPVPAKEGEEEEKEVGEREIIVPEVDEAAIVAPGEDDDPLSKPSAVEPDEDHGFDEEELFGDEKDQW